MNSKINFSQGVEISKPDKIRQRQRMLSYTRSFKGIRQSRRKYEK